MTEMGFVGTRLFASPNAHFMTTQSRRDDLISLGYTLIYLDWFSIFYKLSNLNFTQEIDENSTKAKGSLPWRGLKPNHNDDDQIKRIGEAKNQMIHRELNDLIKLQPMLGQKGTAFTLSAYGF